MALFESPAGIWPAMITPFKEDWSIDWVAVDTLTDWYVEAGVAGLFAVGQSAEMFKLSNAERLALARRVVERADGRVPVVASGTFDGTIAEQADFIKRMAETGVKAVTVIASKIAEHSVDDSIWMLRLEQLMHLSGDISLALYECPEPYHRMIAPDVLRWAAESNRFAMLKETSRSIDSVRAKIAATKDTPLRVYNADTTTLLPSLISGGHGYCGIAANFYPDILSWLFREYVQYPEIAANTQRLIGILDPILHNKYPICAKYFRWRVTTQTISRVSNAQLDDYEKRVLNYVAGVVEQHQHDLSLLK